MTNVAKKIASAVCATLMLLELTSGAAAANMKSSLGEYAGRGSLSVEETLLASCDTRDDPQITAPGGAAKLKAVIDTDEKTEGEGSFSVEWKSAGAAKFFRIPKFNEFYDCANAEYLSENGENGEKSESGSETLTRTKTTIKLDLYVNDISLLKADHEGLYDLDFSGVGTVYLRAESGRRESIYHAVNQTIAGSGWQEIEFSFDHDNGVSDAFNINEVTGLWISATANKPGLVVKVDNVRLCRYISEGWDAGDASEYIPRGARVISYCDYDALCGEVITEWFNTDFSEETKLSGSSSLHLYTDGGDDERIFWGGLDLTASHVYDFLCFWVYVDDVDALGSWFIELNEIQDKEGHEYEFTDALTAIKTSPAGGLKSGTWTMIRLALPFFSGRGELPVRHLRMVPRAKNGREANVYIDNVFLATRAELKAYDEGYPEPEETAETAETETETAVESAAETTETAAETETSETPDTAENTEAADKAPHDEGGKKSSLAPVLIGSVAAVFVIGFAAGFIIKRRRMG